MYINDTKDKLQYSYVTECCVAMKKYKDLKPDATPTVTIVSETEEDR